MAFDILFILGSALVLYLAQWLTSGSRQDAGIFAVLGAVVAAVSLLVYGGFK